MEDFINLFNNPWIIGICVAVIAGLVLYYVFGIGKGQQSTKDDKSSFIAAKGGVTAGRDIIVGSKTLIKKIKTKTAYKKLRSRTIILTPSERKKNISLPINFVNFNKITSKISLSNAENAKWRVGYIFMKNTSPKKEYIFHVFQDSRSNDFHSRIVEIEPGREIEPDYLKYNIGVEDTKKFKLDIKRKNDELYFYVDGIPLGKYSVSLKTIDDLSIRAWSHKDHPPITVIIKDILWS